METADEVSKDMISFKEILEELDKIKLGRPSHITIICEDNDIKLVWAENPIVNNLNERILSFVHQRIVYLEPLDFGNVTAYIKLPYCNPLIQSVDYIMDFKIPKELVDDAAVDMCETITDSKKYVIVPVYDEETQEHIKWEHCALEGDCKAYIYDTNNKEFILV